MLPQLATLLAKPFLTPESKDKFKSVTKLLTDGSGEAWIAVARQQVTLPFTELTKGPSNAPVRGEAALDGKPVSWVQFDWLGCAGSPTATSKLSAGVSTATALSALRQN